MSYGGIIISSPVRPPSKKPEQPPPLSSSARTIGALALVDRDDEAYQLARSNIGNKRDVTDHPTLVTAGQLYGAGKSQMGRHAVERVRMRMCIRFAKWAVRCLVENRKEPDARAARAAAVERACGGAR